jgi:hypothetical protein
VPKLLRVSEYFLGIIIGLKIDRHHMKVFTQAGIESIQAIPKNRFTRLSKPFGKPSMEVQVRSSDQTITTLEFCTRVLDRPNILGGHDGPELFTINIFRPNLERFVWIIT